MTATERLRQLLDERGVEWEADDTQVDSHGTMYCVTYVKERYEGRTWVYEEPPDCALLVSYDHDVRAGDAIDLTLGYVVNADLRQALADLWPRASFTMCPENRESWLERLAKLGVEVDE